MISKQFARCVAKISGDGCLCKNYVRYNNTSKILLDEFEKDMKDEFGEIKLTKGVQNSGTSFLQTNRRQVRDKFLSILPDYRSSAIKVPDTIKESSLEIKKEYLRAFFDDEGSPSLRFFNKTKEWKRNINLTSNSFIMLQEIKQILLDDFSIKSNNIFRTRKNSSRDKSYVLSITGKDNFINFEKHIKFAIPKKRTQVKLMIESYGNTYARNNSGFKKIKEKLDLCTHSKIKVEQRS